MQNLHGGIEMETNALALRGMDEIERAAGAMVKSNYFQDAKEASQAVVKILAGQEMGFGPFASMTGIYIIQGRPSIGANLMAAAVKSSRRYNYRVAEMTDTACEIIFLEQGQECGRSRFTIEDARKAQTKNLDKFPRNMLFARAMSNGCRWYCPDIFSGAPAYTPEELGANVNEAGEVIDYVPPTPVVTVTKPTAAIKPATAREAVITDQLYSDSEPAQTMTLEAAMAVTGSDGVKYGDRSNEQIAHALNSIEKKLKESGLTIEQKETYQYKRDAMKVVLQSRN
jgi:hypothetical protein